MKYLLTSELESLISFTDLVRLYAFAANRDLIVFQFSGGRSN